MPDSISLVLSRHKPFGDGYQRVSFLDGRHKCVGWLSYFFPYPQVEHENNKHTPHKQRHLLNHTCLPYQKNTLLDCIETLLVKKYFQYKALVIGIPSEASQILIGTWAVMPAGIKYLWTSFLYVLHLSSVYLWDGQTRVCRLYLTHETRCNSRPSDSGQNGGGMIVFSLAKEANYVKRLQDDHRQE